MGRVLWLLVFGLASVAGDTEARSKPVKVMPEMVGANNTIILQDGQMPPELDNHLYANEMELEVDAKEAAMLYLGRSRSYSDDKKVTADQKKVDADQKKVDADQKKVTADQEKVTADQKKVTADQKKVTVDQKKVTADQKPDKDEAKVAADKKVHQPHVCGSEGETCECTGTVDFGRKFVKGTPGSGAITSIDQMKKKAAYKTKEVEGSIKCTVHAMGGDPVYGVYKHCYCTPQAQVASTLKAIWQCKVGWPSEGIYPNWSKGRKIGPICRVTFAECKSRMDGKIFLYHPATPDWNSEFCQEVFGWSGTADGQYGWQTCEQAEPVAGNLGQVDEEYKSGSRVTWTASVALLGFFAGASLIVALRRRGGHGSEPLLENECAQA